MKLLFCIDQYCIERNHSRGATNRSAAARSPRLPILCAAKRCCCDKASAVPPACWPRACSSGARWRRQRTPRPLARAGGARLASRLSRSTSRVSKRMRSIIKQLHTAAHTVQRPGGGLFRSLERTGQAALRAPRQLGPLLAPGARGGRRTSPASHLIPSPLQTLPPPARLPPPPPHTSTPSSLATPSLPSDLAADFAREHLAPHAAAWDEKSHFPIDALKRAAELGFGGVYTPEEFGGAGLSRAGGGLLFSARQPCRSACRGGAGGCRAGVAPPSGWRLLARPREARAPPDHAPCTLAPRGPSRRRRGAAAHSPLPPLPADGTVIFEALAYGDGAAQRRARPPAPAAHGRRALAAGAPRAAAG